MTRFRVRAVAILDQTKGQLKVHSGTGTVHAWRVLLTMIARKPTPTRLKASGVRGCDRKQTLLSLGHLDVPFLSTCLDDGRLSPGAPTQ